MINASLIISHNIFLNENERYKLSVDREPIEKTGVFTPVWMNGDVTTEPASEFFCKYEIKNDADKGSEVKRTKKGFSINIPQIPKEYVKQELSNEEWRKMNQNEKDDWYRKNPTPDSGENLLNIKDGGSEYLHFQHVISTKNNKGDAVHLVHFVKMRDVEKLEKSILHPSSIRKK
jgi:hypothetical protein